MMNNTACPFDVISLCYCWMLCAVKCEACLLLWRNVTHQPKLVENLLFKASHSILSICIYHRECKAKSRMSVYSCEDSFIVPTPQGCQHPSNIILRQSLGGPPPPGIFLRAICSLCLLLVDKTVPVGVLYLRGCKRNVSRFNSSLHCCSPPCLLISWIQVATLEGALGSSSHLQNLEGVSCNGINMSNFNVPEWFP